MYSFIRVHSHDDDMSACVIVLFPFVVLSKYYGNRCTLYTVIVSIAEISTRAVGQHVYNAVVVEVSLRCDAQHPFLVLAQCK